MKATSGGLTQNRQGHGSHPPGDAQASKESHMVTEEELLKNYGFPHTPYPVQMELMQKVYSTLENGGVGILESPTGTGKTLSLLCPTLAWMRQCERKELAKKLLAEDGGCSENAEDWAVEHRHRLASSLADSQFRMRRLRREQRRDRLRRSGAITAKASVPRDKSRRIDYSLPASSVNDEAEFSLEQPPALPQLEEELSEQDERQAQQDEAFETKLQVIFCSRTHSQLAQVLKEITRLPKGSVPEDLSVVTLGARQNLCVNDSVKARAQGGGHLNDLCKKACERSKEVGGCSLKKQAHNLADACLNHLLDIESMAQLGRAPVGGGCPYYGSRQAAKEADVLLVPYVSLINHDTRKKLGIRTKDNILIFDEAHNLLDAISDANSVAMTASQARNAVDELSLYADRYEARLSSGNAMRLRQLKQFCTLLHRHLQSVEKSTAQIVGAFLVSMGADHYDLPQLTRFLEATELPRKVRGYVESLRLRQGSCKKSVAAAASEPRIPAASGAVYAVSELLGSLNNSTSSDRVLCSGESQGEGGEATVRYLSLDAESRFQEILASARAILFVGGTLEPRSEFAPLYAGLGTTSPDSVQHFSGRHVVPASHIFARYVTHGPGGALLDFRKEMRSSAQQKSELKSIIDMAAATTPGGSIFFFPSFDYLATVASVIGGRAGGRRVLVERRKVGSGSGGSVDEIFQAFASAVRNDGGAVLLAVNGAKLSEGIDFKDELCRLVAVVGLPYPNAHDLGMIEKMRFLDRQRSEGRLGLSGKEYYSARCMKGVNQCVGRSIRHIGDWAAILLLDHRYATPNINGQVSLWLREQASASTFSATVPALRDFFESRVRPSSKLAAINATPSLAGA